MDNLDCRPDRYILASYLDAGRLVFRGITDGDNPCQFDVWLMAAVGPRYISVHLVAKNEFPKTVFAAAQGAIVKVYDTVDQLWQSLENKWGAELASFAEGDQLVLLTKEPPATPGHPRPLPAYGRKAARTYDAVRGVLNACIAIHRIIADYFDSGRDPVNGPRADELSIVCTRLGVIALKAHAECDDGFAKLAE